MESSFQKTVTYHFKKPDEISPQILDQIQLLIKKGGEVGSAFIKENLENAFLISYALDQVGLVVGTVTLKHPKEAYRRKIEAITGLDLSGYLERGYTSVERAFRNSDVADRLIKGLIDRSRGQKIYVTIRMDNKFALELTYKNNMVLAARFINERTGHKIGVFINKESSP
ncbi:MAG: hypothetical protein PVH82_13285 [Desulfobacteraceae bacterium]|jgi:hypothetical protein